MYGLHISPQPPHPPQNTFKQELGYSYTLIKKVMIFLIYKKTLF